jgi:signal transduction histidine kinase
MKQLTTVHLLAVPAAILALALGAAALDGWPALVPALGSAGLAALSARRLLGLTGRVEAEKVCLDEQLVQSQKLASIGELSSGIAHEINNPLAIIGQEVEWVDHLLTQGEWSPPQSVAEVRDSVREINRQVERCRDITHKLLGFARKMEPVVQDTDLARLVEDMVRLMEKEANLKGIAVARSYAPDLPQLRTDPPLLRQVVLNLLTNAVHAAGQNGQADQAGPGSSITVSTRDEPGFLAISVADTGPGIPPDILPKIFDPFFTTKPTGTGTGLGLSISHGIVFKLGGRIDVQSEPGKGAVFTIRLPKHSG